MLVPAPWPGTQSSTQTFKQVVYLWAAGPGARGTKALRAGVPGDFPEQEDFLRSCRCRGAGASRDHLVRADSDTWQNREKSHHGKNGQMPWIRTTPESPVPPSAGLGWACGSHLLNADCSPHVYSWDGHQAQSPREEGLTADPALSPRTPCNVL